MAIFKSRKKSASASLQTKTATADTDDILVIPDTGYDGMSSVTVHPTPSETKTVTATTSQQTVTPTSGKYMSEVTVNPQAHTTTYTPSEDTASNDMGANHDYRYVDTSGMITPTGTKSITSNGTGIDVAEYAEVDVNVPTVTPTSITPSNSSPVALSANTPVNPTASGYAIASYEEIDVPKPSHHYTIRPDMPTISRVGALEGVEQLHFHSIDPSNSDPDTITDGEIYIADGSGKAVASITDVLPSSTPTSVSMDDIVHIQGSGVIVDAMPPTPTSITPSNATPASITSGNSYTATGNGYAIESYTNVRPSNLGAPPVSIGDIYKMQDDGYVVKSNPERIVPDNDNPSYISADNVYSIDLWNGVVIESFSDITPSNSSPATITSGGIYKATASGKAISSLSEVAPSNANPPNVHTGDICKITTRNGYLISTTNIVEPSDSDPPLLSNDNSWYKLNGASGYLYHTIQPKVKTGTVTLNSSSTTKITCGFKPKYIALMIYKDTTHFSEHIYNSDANENYTFRGAINGASQGAIAISFPTTATSTSGVIMSTDSTGFTVAPASTTGHGTTGYYFAIG